MYYERDLKLWSQVFLEDFYCWSFPWSLHKVYKRYITQITISIQLTRSPQTGVEKDSVDGRNLWDFCFGLYINLSFLYIKFTTAEGVQRTVFFFRLREFNCFLGNMSCGVFAWPIAMNCFYLFILSIWPNLCVKCQLGFSVCHCLLLFTRYVCVEHVEAFPISASQEIILSKLDPVHQYIYIIHVIIRLRYHSNRC